MFVNISPSTYNETETLNTLTYGFRAKAIENSAGRNVETKIVAQLRKSIEVLQRQNQALRRGEVRRAADGVSASPDVVGLVWVESRGGGAAARGQVHCRRRRRHACRCRCRRGRVMMDRGETLALCWIFIADLDGRRSLLMQSLFCWPWCGRKVGLPGSVVGESKHR
jgi:hypothetical protein